MTRARAVCGGALAAALFGCGGSGPPPQAPEATHEEVVSKPPPLKMKSELGVVDPEAVTRAFHGLEAKFDACQRRGLGRVEVLAGKLKFFVRIGEDGSARWTYLEQSDVGDRETERCLLDAVLASRWPKPDGGDAEARYSMELPRKGAPATTWPSDRVSGALGKAEGAIGACKAGASGSYSATLYVGPGGKVLAAGVSVPSKDGAAKADCIAEALEKLKGLPSPGSWPAKVTVGL